ncbi:universal stress protein [Luteirhabdus pelagi]|uniref:universal stress protein n=1 Tax=Luteirhabdus pelagi TaxID=2792783 RepID=UPI00193A5994|nr:hypothetical protein [Luteirhabdus pelagi]
MKKVLIPVNVKNNSYEAVDNIVHFFKKEPCEFYFLNTYYYDINGLNAIDLLHADDEYFEKPKRESENKLGQVIDKFICNNRNDKHRFNAISKCSDLVIAIKSIVKELGIDLVVLSGSEEQSDRNRYGRNTKRIIETIRECPVIIIPAAVNFEKKPKFVLVSNFEVDLPKAELENWYDLVRITKGSIKIVSFSSKNELSELQKVNQDKVRFQLEMLSENPIKVVYIENAPALKDFAHYHSDYIVCLMDRKPNFWRKWGISHSQLINIGPLHSTPVMALHR